jgi:L-rhamnose isomerase
MALDYFDASINRIAAWAVGIRSWQKALLMALCTPNEKLRELQDANKLTELLVMSEEIKTLPFGDVWQEYCTRSGVAPDASWFNDVCEYEEKVLLKR